MHAPNSGAMSQTTRRLATALLGLVVLAGLIAADELILRRLFGTHYLRWCLANGALISLVFAFVTLAWGELNRLPGLISAHPLAPRGGIQAGGNMGAVGEAPIGLPVVDSFLTVVLTREISVESGPRSEGVPADAHESGYSGQPVTLTAGVAAALLFTAQQVIP